MPSGSDDPDVLRFLALAAGSDVELDVLALFERLVAGALDVGEVDENVSALFPGDESVALLGVEELHGASCQCISLSVPEAIRSTVSVPRAYRGWESPASIVPAAPVDALELTRHGGVAEWLRQGPAKPCTRVRFPAPPPDEPSRGVRSSRPREVDSPGRRS